MKSLATILGAVLAAAAIALGQGPGGVRVIRRPSTSLSPTLGTRASLTTQYRWLVSLSIVAIIGLISSWVAWARKLKKAPKPPAA